MSNNFLTEPSQTISLQVDGICRVLDKIPKGTPAAFQNAYNGTERRHFCHFYEWKDAIKILRTQSSAIVNKVVQHQTILPFKDGTFEFFTVSVKCPEAYYPNVPFVYLFSIRRSASELKANQASLPPIK